VQCFDELDAAIDALFGPSDGIDPFSIEPNQNFENKEIFDNSLGESLSNFIALPKMSNSKNNHLIRGINLGGWLVLEPWITPSLFNPFLDKPPERQAVDEYTLTALLGKDQATKTMQRHWSTWITGKDFQSISSAGITHVRIPVGYWIVDLLPNEPFVEGGMEYLLKGIEWAKQNNLKVMIDLHGG